jgi:manganese/zinc/iron transport system substrate-binding protein
MITDAACNIAGPHMRVVGLMGPGIDPHSYRARERDVHLLAQADLILYHGLHLEGKMGELFAALERQKAPVVAVTRSLSRLQLKESSFKNIYDPHVWHDVALWQEVVKEISAVMMQLDGARAAEYKKRCDEYVARLDALDGYVKGRVTELALPQRILVTAHDAFSYFGTAYTFQVIGLQGISTQAEVGLKDLQKLVMFLVQHHVPAIFLESSVLPRALKAVEHGTSTCGWHVKTIDALYSDSLGIPGSMAYSYEGMIKHNIDTIVDALKADIREGTLC